MNETSLVGVMESQRCLPDEVGSVHIAQRTLGQDEVLQSLALNVLHHQEMNFPALFDFLAVNVVGSNDVRVIQ